MSGEFSAKHQKKIVEDIFKTHPYTRMPKFISRMTEISSFSKFVFAYLLGCIRPGGGGKCYPKIRTISIEIGVSCRTVKRSIAELRDVGLIKSERFGVFGRNLYVLQNIPEWIISKYSGAKIHDISEANLAHLLGPNRPRSKEKKKNISTLNRVDREKPSETFVQKRLKEVKIKNTPLDFGGKKVRGADGTYHTEYVPENR
jgi:hypothetical protein